MRKQGSTSKSAGKSIAKGTTPKRKQPGSLKGPKTASMSVEDLLQFITGDIHAISPVSVQPRTEMWRWGLYQVKAHGVRSRHLVGLADGEGRVCSAIVQWDLKSLCATTESGRVYLLVGPPGWNPDADYVFGRWKAVNGCEQVKHVTRALLRLRTMRGIPMDPSWQRITP